MYLLQFGHSYEKYVPESIKMADKEAIQRFLDAYLLGDGTLKKSTHKTKDFSSDTRMYFTSSPRMQSDLCELIVKS